MDGSLEVGIMDGSSVGVEIVGEALGVMDGALEVGITDGS